MTDHRTESQPDEAVAGQGSEKRCRGCEDAPLSERVPHSQWCEGACDGCKVEVEVAALEARLAEAKEGQRILRVENTHLRDDLRHNVQEASVERERFQALEARNRHLEQVVTEARNLDRLARKGLSIWSAMAELHKALTDLDTHRSEGGG